MVMVIGATNRLFELDVVLRRLPRRLFVDLPEKERRGILKILLRGGNVELDVEKIRNFFGTNPKYAPSPFLKITPN